MKRIKKVIRTNFPETNSSSSHSVVICTNKNSLIPNPLRVRKDGTLFISERGEDFGWEYEKYNTVLEKLWYVCGIIFNYGKGNGKKKRLLVDVLKKYTGAKKVVFEWEEKRKKHPENYDPDDIYNTGAPEIDHNSSDIFPEIIESRESIKNFIFNDRSWLFLGNDNSSAPDGFYDVGENAGENTCPEAIASIEFGGKIGRVDVEISKFPGEDIMDVVTSNTKISNMYYDNSPGVGEWKFANETGWSKFRGEDLKSLMKSLKDNAFFINRDMLLKDEKIGEQKVVWTSDKLLDLIVSAVGVKSYYYINYTDPEQRKKIDNIMDENKDLWIALPITIVTSEFGKL